MKTLRGNMEDNEGALLWVMASRGFCRIKTTPKGRGIQAWTFTNSEAEGDTITITYSGADPHFPWGFVRPATRQARYALETGALMALINDI